MKKLEWRDISEYEGLYKVCEDGTIKSMERIVAAKNGTTQKIKEKIRLSYHAKGGYDYVTLGRNGKSKTFLIHRIVAKEFISNPLNEKCINHIDENKHNNHYSNLEWCSYSYNNTYKSIHLRRNTDKINRPIIQYTIEMKEIKRWKSFSSIVEELKISGPNIIKCCKYERNHTGGFKWRYYE